jgi:rhodanese-related sulfurtransferase
VKVCTQQQSGLRLKQGIRQGVFLLTIATLLAGGVNGFRSAGLPWIGNWSASSVSAYHLQGLEEISLEETCSLYQQGNAVFLDARDPVSFQEGHIDGALNVPPEEAEDYREEVLAMVNAGFEVIAYCDGVDCPLSPELARALQRLGIPSVKVFVDGWSRWRNAGCPVEKGGYG